MHGFSLRGTSAITSSIYIGLPALLVMLGLVEVIVQHNDNEKVLGTSKICSISLQAVAILALITTRQPYATVLMFLLFIIKIILLVKSSRIQ